LGGAKAGSWNSKGRLFFGDRFAYHYQGRPLGQVQVKKVFLFHLFIF